MTGTGLDGEPVAFTGDGLLARCLQHETDHLRGTVFGDRLADQAAQEAAEAARPGRRGVPGGLAGLAADPVRLALVALRGRLAAASGPMPCSHSRTRWTERRTHSGFSGVVRVDRSGEHGALHGVRAR